MKTRTKALLLVLCAVMLAAASALGIMAYLTDTESVVNTFTVGSVYINLDETKVDIYGDPVEGAARVQANEYKLLPGRTYVKDPTVTVEKHSEEAYIRMMVTVNNEAALDAIGVNIMEVFRGYDPSKWLPAGESKDDAADTRTYEFRYFETVTAPETDNLPLEPLFTHMVIPGAITKEQLAT